MFYLVILSKDEIKIIIKLNFYSNICILNVWNNNDKK